MPLERNRDLYGPRKRVIACLDLLNPRDEAMEEQARAAFDQGEAAVYRFLHDVLEKKLRDARTPGFFDTPDWREPSPPPPEKKASAAQWEDLAEGEDGTPTKREQRMRARKEKYVKKRAGESYAIPADAADRRAEIGVAVSYLEKTRADADTAAEALWKARLVKLVSLLAAEAQDPPAYVQKVLKRSDFTAYFRGQKPEEILPFLDLKKSPLPTFPEGHEQHPYRGDEQPFLEDGEQCLRYHAIWQNLNKKVARALLERLRLDRDGVARVPRGNVPNEWGTALAEAPAPAPAPAPTSAPAPPPPAR